MKKNPIKPIPFSTFDEEKKENVLHLRYRVIPGRGRKVFPAIDYECSGQMVIDMDECFQDEKGKLLDVLKGRRVIKFIFEAGTEDQIKTVTTYFEKSLWNKEFKAIGGKQ
ncbi:MAG: hypothetical protein K0M69_15820 [Youngiibacter sp.]|nr:hypothetical protein [Youngiibacter sp.]